MPCHRLLVDEGAVRALQILEKAKETLANHTGVMAGDSGVVDHHMVVGQSSDLHALWTNDTFTQHAIFELQDQLRHRVSSELSTSAIPQALPPSGPYFDHIMLRMIVHPLVRPAHRVRQSDRLGTRARCNYSIGAARHG